MKRNEILGEHKKGTKAVKYNKKAKNPSAEFGKAKEKLAPQKPMEENLEQEALYRSRGSSSAYDRDYKSSISGMDGSDKRNFKRREMEHELGHETNNYAVAINGRTWKVFASRNHAEAVARSLQNKGKDASVHETGAEPTAETAGDPVGTVSSATPDGKVSIKTSTGSEIQTSKDALMPGANGTLQMKPDAAGDALKPGAKVISTEEAQALHDMLRIAGLR
jgi:hypothetical protein